MYQAGLASVLSTPTWYKNNALTKEGNIIETKKPSHWATIASLVTSALIVLVLYLAWPSIADMSQYLDPRSWVTHTNSKSDLDKAREDYLNKRDLTTMLAYGRAIDTAMVNMDFERAELEKEFYHQLAKTAGDSVGVPWNYLYGVWMRESEMNPEAKGDGKVDAAGHIIPGSFRAFGLGQIHLRTALDVDPTATKEKLMDPIYNGFTSAKVLKKYTAIMDGNIRYGISAYQQGPAPARAQYVKRMRPANIDYVLDVYQFAAEVLVEEHGHTK